MINYFSLVVHAIILAAFVALYWKAGQIESPATNQLSIFWCALSVIVFALSWYLGWSYLAMIAAQFALALIIATVRAAISALPRKP